MKLWILLYWYAEAIVLLKEVPPNPHEIPLTLARAFSRDVCPMKGTVQSPPDVWSVKATAGGTHPTVFTESVVNKATTMNRDKHRNMPGLMGGL